MKFLNKLELTNYSVGHRKQLENDLKRISARDVHFNGMEVSDETSGHVADMIWDLPRKELPYQDDGPYAYSEFRGWIIGTDRFVFLWQGEFNHGGHYTVVVFSWNAKRNKMRVEDFWQYDSMPFSKIMKDIHRRCRNLVDLFPRTLPAGMTRVRGRRNERSH